MATNFRVSSTIGTLVTVFHEYASKDCKEGKVQHVEGEACEHQYTLSKRELKELAIKEFDIDKVTDQAMLDKLMKELDDDGDGQISFKEYVDFVANLACACNVFLELILTEESDE